MHVDRRHRHADLRRKRVGDGPAHVLGNLDEAVTVIRLDGNGDGDLLVALRPQMRTPLVGTALPATKAGLMVEMAPPTPHGGRHRAPRPWQAR